MPRLGCESDDVVVVDDVVVELGDRVLRDTLLNSHADSFCCLFSGVNLCGSAATARGLGAPGWLR